MFRSVHQVVSISLIAIAALSSGAPAVIPQEREAVISGKLIGPDSIPLRRARVTIVGSGMTATTDSTGTFFLRHSLSGTQTIELGHLDFESLILPPIRIPQAPLRLNAMLQRRIPEGPAGDSARAAAVMRGGRGGDRTPIVLLDGVILQRPVMGDTSKARSPTEVDVLGIDVLTGNAAMQMFGSRARYGAISIESCFPARAARGPCR